MTHRLWMQVGARQGLSLAAQFTLLLLFMILGFFWLASLVIVGWQTYLFTFFLTTLGIGLIMGVLPAVIIASVSGAIIGMISAQEVIAPYRWRRLLVGVVIALVGIGVLGSIGFLHVREDSNEQRLYLLAIGIPSVLHLFICSYIATGLPTFVQEAETVIEVPIDESPSLPMEL